MDGDGDSGGRVDGKGAARRRAEALALPDHLGSASRARPVIESSAEAAIERGERPGDTGLVRARAPGETQGPKDVVAQRPARLPHEVTGLSGGHRVPVEVVAERTMTPQDVGVAQEVDLCAP